MDWSPVAPILQRMARHQPPGRVLSLSLPLTAPMALALPLEAEGMVWRRPRQGLSLLGLGRTLGYASAGANRFSAPSLSQLRLSQGLHHGPATLPPLGFLGFAFQTEGGTPLPNSEFWLPELLYREQEGRAWLTLNCTAATAEGAVERWQALWAAAQPRPEAAAAPWAMPADPDVAAFRQRGESALAAIQRGSVDKLVLTRCQRYTLSAPLPVAALLAALTRNNPDGAIFALSRAGVLFAGASPETLLSLDGHQISVDALAGTAWQHSRLGLGADKNQREHDVVAQAVASALARLCPEIEVPDAPEILQLNHLSHLRRRIRARRPDKVTAFDLIQALHPTPAIGGAPRQAALDWLQRHGDQREAWYTGGIGWIDARGDCDIAVALRCGLFLGREARLYAGAGIVAGSCMDEELAETEAKLATLRQALFAACPSATPAERAPG